MVSIVIDDFEFKVKPQISILEACKIVGINIPRFCYHEILSVAGNCRMCLVEVDGIDKPVASCVTEINEGIAVYTNTPFVKKARENVVEALLLNHPLDCPICDQAGECDLQDQTKAFGSVNSRYFFNKKGTEDKYCGPLIKTIMTRCITCTRCVRYSTEITGVDFFGTLNRGGSTEIGPYVPHFFNSEISGNVIDLCPVGALTSKPYAFKARPWELRLTETIDTTNAEGIHIYVNHKETEIFRILPRSNKNINSNLISDKTRFTYDANGVNRILHPFVKNTSSGKYIKKDWKRFFLNCDYRINLSNPTTIYIDGNCDFESAVSIKELEYLTKNKVKVHNIDFMNYENIYVKNQYNVLNTVKSICGNLLVLGIDLKQELPILNVAIKKKTDRELIEVNSFGFNDKKMFNNNFKYFNLNMKKVFELLEGKTVSSLEFGKNEANYSLLVLGTVVKRRLKNQNLITDIFYNKINNFKILNSLNKANSFGLKDLSIKNSHRKYKKKQKILHYSFFFNLDENTFVKKKLKETVNAFNFWFNTHGSKSALKCNYIIPINSNYENENIFINISNTIQKTVKVIKTAINNPKSFSMLQSIFNFPNSYYKYPHMYKHFFEKFNLLHNESNLVDFCYPIINKIELNKKNAVTSIIKYPIFKSIKSFHNDSVFTKNSTILNKCKDDTKYFFNNFYL